MLQVNPGTVLLLLCALLAAGWAAGLVRARFDEGRLKVRLWRSGLSVTLELRDTWLLLVFALVLGWSVAAAVEHSAWIPQTDGRLVPAVALAVGFGWLLVVAGASRAGYLLGSLIGIIGGLAIITPSPLTGGFTPAAMGKWLSDLSSDTNLKLLIGMLSMLFVTGLWTSWWTFKRRNGLVALLPSGIILAVEIINDTSASLVFYTLVWLIAAAAMLLRLNFVDLKYSWRRRRLPHASDTGWAFGEIGVEATVGILLVAFLMPPLSNTDISGILIPGVVRPDDFHPFGIGAPGNPGSVGTVGYSDVVRPGSQLKAKSELVMVISGESPTLYPYWRGAALAGWDGIEWYPLPSTDAVPVRQQPVVKAGASIPRDDLPPDKSRTQVIRDSIHVVVPASQLKETVFGAGELLSVKGQPVSVRGIMTSVPAPPGPNPPLVNVAGDNQPVASFDTVDKVLFAHQPQGNSFTYSVTEALPDVAIADLENAGTDYPVWITPYLTLYYNDQVAAGYSTARDADIAALAHQIVTAAGAKNPYDQAKAIEAWFLTKGRFTYTLAPPPAPPKVRPLDNFLFNTHRGYCQDFSTAMNVMLRLLGIPSRQMTGFSLGTLDVKTHSYNIDSVDAHSWVEVYFPGYGWQPFEPTPDGVDQPVNRPATRSELNVPLPLPSGVARPGQLAGIRDPTVAGGTGSGSASPFPDLLHPILIALGLLGALGLLALLFGLRWLLAARDLPRIWRRLLFLGDRLQVRRRAGDTPQEFADRLAATLPDLDPELRSLAALYTRASFRRGGVTTDEVAEARRSWARVRGRYAGLVARAWRDALRNGRVVSAEAAEASESRAPSRRP